jgi:SAM-dependent methyltransferase
MFSEDHLRLVHRQIAESRDQRKHIRLEHGGTVELIGEGRRFSGRAVNISRSGMQVVVNLPDSYEAVRSITFTLPNTDHTIELPCRIVRSESENGNDRAGVLGLEFSNRADAQILLIENYIRDLKREQLSTFAQEEEMRRVYRASCSLRRIETEKENLRVVSIDNISTDGLLVSYIGELEPDESISVSVCLPGDTRSLKLSGQVKYVIDNMFRGVSYGGIRLRNVGKTDRARLRNFVIQATSGSTVRQLHEMFSTRDLDPSYQINDPQKISAIFETLRHRSSQINVLFETSLAMQSLNLVEISEDRHLFFSNRPSKLSIPADVIPLNAYFSFFLAEGSYYFKTELTSFCEQGIGFRFPSVIYQSEKRSYQRKILELQTDVDLMIPSENNGKENYKGRLVDISWRGFLCELPLNEQTTRAFRQGTYVEYLIYDRFGLDNHGLVRHLKAQSDERGNQLLHIGIEAGIQHSGFKYRRFSREEWDRTKAHRQIHSSPFQAQVDTIPIRYKNNENQEIAALLNATRLPVTAPVVLVPPAFGKKKEALSPLVLTLLQNFKRKGKDLVVLRFDGINRPGESYSMVKNPERGSEMLHYRLSQGLRDLRTSLDYVHSNTFFTPQKVILITFSMSSIDARKLLMDGQGHLVDHWISCMGIPSAKSTIGNILGGIDIIGNYKMDMQTGKGGLLGYLVDFDTLAKDLIDNKYAYLTDSRNDMSKIPHPVLWIYGSHDKWTEQEEVQDIMAVKSKGRREVLEIPTGHNLRSSSDAIMTFSLITAYLYEQLYGKPLDVISPDKEQMIRLISYERERLSSNEELDREKYWKNYLLGAERNSSGYDFYGNLVDFCGFLRLEAELIDPGGGERIADMGCGTGLLTETMLQRLIDKGEATRPVEFVAIDLVEDALAKTREKWERLSTIHPQLKEHSLKLVRRDLEPNRLLPVKMFLENPGRGFDFLRNRIAGLRNVTVDLLKQKACPELRDILCGCHLGENKRLFLERTLDSDYRHVVTDFNRAARFLKRKLVGADLMHQTAGPDVPLPRELYRSLNCGNIRFDVLDFGCSTPHQAPTFSDCCFDKIIASLFISYVHNPDLILNEFYRMLKQGGLLLVSSMRVDSDISTLFTEYIDEVQSTETQATRRQDRDQNLTAARAMLNEAAALFTLEEDGYFRFFSEEELATMVEAAGFGDVRAYWSLGNPPQAVVVTGKKPE